MKVEVLYGNPPALTDSEDFDGETDEEESPRDYDADMYYQIPILMKPIEHGVSGEIALQSLLIKQLNPLFIFR